MKNWEEDDDAEHCAAAADLDDARAICSHLDIPLHSVNFSYEYWERVFTRFLSEYRAGRTPNPDVLCNREVKVQRVRRTREGPRGDTHRHRPLRPHEGKSRCLASAQGNRRTQGPELLSPPAHPGAACELPLPGRRDAQGGGARRRSRGGTPRQREEGQHRNLLHRGASLPPLPRALRRPRSRPDSSGRRESVSGATTDSPTTPSGSGRDSESAGGRAATGIPGTVCGKDLENNRLRVVQGREHPALHCREIATGPAHWIAGRPPSLPLGCRARIRYRQPDQSCTVRRAEGGGIRVCFEEAQWAAAPGQAIVFYRGEECLGGADIESAG